MADLEIVSYNRGPLDNNVYVLLDSESKRGALIDPAPESRDVLADIRNHGWIIERILITHGHFDHVYESAHFARELGAPLFIHEADAAMMAQLPATAARYGFEAEPPPTPASYLRDGDDIDVAGHAVRVVHAPGHSPGSVCFVWDGHAIVGDVLFRDGIGRTDLPGGSMPQLLASIRERLFTLPDETEVHPGHGRGTTIGREKLSNPFFT